MYFFLKEHVSSWIYTCLKKLSKQFQSKAFFPDTFWNVLCIMHCKSDEESSLGSFLHHYCYALSSHLSDYSMKMWNQVWSGKTGLTVSIFSQVSNSLDLNEIPIYLVSHFGPSYFLAIKIMSNNWFGLQWFCADRVKAP